MVLALLILLVAVPVVADESAFQPQFDIRVRQEIQENVYYFDRSGQDDRNWVRFRSRLGAAYDAGRHDFALRLANESRHFVQPGDQDFFWDELIIDRLTWAWQTGQHTRLTVGRQDIIWNRGFLMLDGTPLDGSRTAYHNAARLQSDFDTWDLDVSLIVNPKYDPVVLIRNSAERPLTDADEWALAVRVRRAAWQWSAYWKVDDDPDHRLQQLRAGTVAARFDAEFGETGSLWADLAVQHQAFSGTGIGAPTPDGWAVALQAFAKGNLEPTLTVEGGCFFYSGDDGKDLRAFRTPWGRWPKWSELYTYALIGESTPGRVHVAAWENIAAPRVMLHLDASEHIEAHLGATYLLAPQPRWQDRGVLLQTGLNVDLAGLARGLKSHLIYELLDPGSFHRGDELRPELRSTAHFLRWQITYALK